jgi:hypothetical protein
MKKVEDFGKTEKTHEVITTPFVPDEELLNFATEFSNQYKSLGLGNYCSDNQQYKIKLNERNKDSKTGMVANSPFRIGVSSGIIEIDKFMSENENYTPDFLFFIILWCVACKRYTKSLDFKPIDQMTTEYYLTTERSKNNLLKGYTQLLKNTEYIESLKRMEIIRNLLGEK